jgi:hypothetical protein
MLSERTDLPAFGIFEQVASIELKQFDKIVESLALKLVVAK